MGGPQDEDPPKVVEMSPKDQSLNIKPEEIIITFDEYIKLENATKNIIIKSGNKYDMKDKKEEVKKYERNN